MRQVVLDTETTGLEWRKGNRVVEIGSGPGVAIQLLMVVVLIAGFIWNRRSAQAATA